MVYFLIEIVWYISTLVYCQNRAHKTATIKTARTKPRPSKPRMDQNRANQNRADHNRAIVNNCLNSTLSVPHRHI